MNAELNALIAGVNQASDAEELLRKVQEIVFGTSDISKRNWSVGRRIDDFDLSQRGFRLCVSDSALRIVYRFNVSFAEPKQQQHQFRLVA